MSPNQLDVVVVPGAWTQPSAYRNLAAALEARDFTVHVPALPTNDDSRPPNSTFDADVEAVRQVVKPLVEEDGGKDVVLLMHSYGGVVGTNSIAGLARRDRQVRNLRGGVVQLIYAASSMLAENQTIRTVVREVNLPRRGALVKFEDDGTWFPSDPVSLLYHDLEPEDQKEQLALPRHGNSACLTGEATYEAWRGIPTTYVRAAEDQWLPPEFQDFCLENAANAGVSVNVEVLDSGHSPYVKFANELADMVVKVCRSA
ncbi:Alpha/beta hydrolase fold-1 [Biscogniauxia marginata]|nr:Alpha/beta hydrolase fold-1 [Biscogniauxia marginata]